MKSKSSDKLAVIYAIILLLCFIAALFFAPVFKIGQTCEPSCSTCADCGDSESQSARDSLFNILTGRATCEDCY